MIPSEDILEDSLEDSLATRGRTPEDRQRCAGQFAELLVRQTPPNASRNALGERRVIFHETPEVIHIRCLTAPEPSSL